MLVQYRWLSNLLFIASAAAHAWRPVGLKPRYLATGTGTGISLPSASAPPYPTGTANGTAISTGSIATSTATPTPISPSEFFNLVIADTGTPYDGQYLSIGSSTSGNGPRTLPRRCTESGGIVFDLQHQRRRHAAE